jgi:hypothetical protein
MLEKFFQSLGKMGQTPQPPFRFPTRSPIAGIVQLFNFSTFQPFNFSTAPKARGDEGDLGDFGDGGSALRLCLSAALRDERVERLKS